MVEVEIVGEGVSVDVNSADLPNGSSAARGLAEHILQGLGNSVDLF